MAGGLGRALNAPGGITMTEACARADEHLAAASERSVAIMREAIDTIARLASAAPAPDVRRRLHALACEVTALGGTFGRASLSEVTYNFCRLIDQSEPHWDAAAVAVHVQAMRLLLTPEQLPPGRQQEIVAGLVAVRKRAAGA